MPDDTPAPRRITSDTGPFAIVPEWILDSSLSDRAVRLYALLSRYADADGYSWPSRRTLAARLGRSVDALDRAVKDLVEADVLVVQPRYDDNGDRTSNGYVIRRMPPVPVQGGGRKSAATGGRESTATGSRKSAALTKATLNETNPNEIASPERRDVVWDTLMAVCGVQRASITPSSRGAYNRAVADLKAVDATPEEIGRRAVVFRRKWPNVSMTPTALARRWPECDPDRQHAGVPATPEEQAAMIDLLDAWGDAV